jgi:hypothetical protein
MKNPTSEDTIDKLSMLASRRTARTSQLEDVVRRLLAKLECYVEIRASVEVDGATLRKVSYRSNVGSEEYWVYERPDGNSVELDYGVGSEGYLHGDFNVPLQGPNQSDLIEFSKRAARFVEALLRKTETECADCEEAIASVAAASEVAS